MSGERGGRLSEASARALTFAADLADGQGYADVNCQHLLLALASEPAGLARLALERAGLGYEVLRTLVMQDSAAHERDGSGAVGMAGELQEAVVRAGLLAQAAGQRVVDTEHLLLGLLEESSSADDLFAALRVAPARIQEALRAVNAEAPHDSLRKETAQAAQFTQECSWALAHAQDRARQEGCGQIEAQHLLLGLMQADQGLASLLAETFGLRPQDLIDRMAARRVGPISAGRARLPFSQEVQTAFGAALALAWVGLYSSINPALLLAGLVKQPDHSLKSFLAGFGAGESALIETLEARFPARGSQRR